MDLTEVEAPFFADAPVAAAELTVHVVDEGPLSAVFEEDAHDAGPAGHDRGHHLDDGPASPLIVFRMQDAVAEP